MTSCACDLIASVSMTGDTEQLRKLAAIATDVLGHQDFKANNKIIQKGALDLLGARLIQQLRCRRSLENAAIVSDVIRIILRKHVCYTEEFLRRMGVPLVFELVFFLQDNPTVGSGNGAFYYEKFRLLTLRLASLPWNCLSRNAFQKLVRFLQTAFRNASSDQLCVTTIYFLSELAEDVANKFLLAENPGLVEAVLEKAWDVSSSGKGKDDGAIVVVSCRLLRQLVWGNVNRAAISRREKWNEVLYNLLTNETIGARSEIVEIIAHMSTEQQSRRSMVEYDGATLIKQLVISLRFSEIRSHALYALSNLIDKGTVTQVTASPGLCDILCSMTKEDESSIAASAAKLLKRIASYVNIRDRGHANIVDALLECAHSPFRAVRLWAAKGLLAQSHASSNAFFMARNKEVVSALISLSTDRDTTVRQVAITTLFQVASETSNTKRAALTTRYLHAFVHNATVHQTSADTDESLATVRISIRGILKLSDHPEGYRRVAKQNGAIEALARYGVSADSDRELKEASLHAVLLLSPFL